MRKLFLFDCTRGNFIADIKTVYDAKRIANNNNRNELFTTYPYLTEFHGYIKT